MFWPAVVYAVRFTIFSLAGAGTCRAQDAELARKLTLKEAVNLAVTNSRDLALARLQYGVMQRQIGVARSAFLPNIYTGTGIAYTSGFPLLEGGGAPAIFSLSYNQQIFNPPLKGEQHAAEQRAEEQRLSMDDVRDTVMSRAALDYLELAKVRHALELMHSERLSAGRILDATRERADSGRELPIEVVRAQLTTARIEERIAQMEDRDDFLSGELRDLMGMPPDMQQAVAVSDAKNRPDHPWTYSWANPDDEKKMKAAMEDLARKALGLPGSQPETASAPKRTGTAARRTAKAAAPPAEPAPLEDEQFRVFELTYGSGATMVLSAHTQGPVEGRKFVTIVGQPDLYGNVLVLLKSVTDTAHLDETPRMRLVDAVDALADNRGELLFELRGAGARQFALYRIYRGTAEKLFVSGGGVYGSLSSN